MEPIRLVIVDDHPLVRDGLRAVCGATPDIVVVGEADSVSTGISTLAALQPDVALVDVQLQDGTGVEVCRTTRETIGGCRCLMLTSHAADQALFDAVNAGAAGYVLKQIDSHELLACVRRVAAGESLIDARSRQQVRQRAARGEGDPLLATLSAQEHRLIDLLARGLSNRQIAAEMFLAEKTVKNYVSRLLSKMGMSCRTEVAAYAARAEERARVSNRAPTGNPVLY